MRRRRTRIDEARRAQWAEDARAYINGTSAQGSERTIVGPRPHGPSPSNETARHAQMCTVRNLPYPITASLSSLQRTMLWAAWHGKLRRDRHGVSIAGERASIVTLRALRVRGLVEEGGGLIGITQNGLVSLELLYTDPRDWATPIEAVVRSHPA
jgi:hypothetical protein